MQTRIFGNLLISLVTIGLCAAQPSQDTTQDPPELPVVHSSIVITASSIEPTVDRVNGEVFENTLFTRDDQIFHQLDGGLNLVQHEGGGKSVEVRRFGFNLDHGGINGGLKVMVDGVQQNQSTQGHGQGYLGSLKSLSPELIEDVELINGPFSAEYGDFSGLGVVHIRQRESLPNKGMLRIQGGSFASAATDWMVTTPPSAPPETPCSISASCGRFRPALT